MSAVILRDVLNRLRGGMFASLQEREMLWGVAFEQTMLIEQRLARIAQPPLPQGPPQPTHQRMARPSHPLLPTPPQPSQPIAPRTPQQQIKPRGRVPTPGAPARVQRQHQKKTYRPRRNLAAGPRPPKVDTRTMTREQRHEHAAKKRNPTTIYVPEDDFVSEGVPYSRVIKTELEKAGWRTGSEERFFRYACANSHRNSRVIINTNCTDEGFLKLFRDQGCQVNVMNNDNPLAAYVRENGSDHQLVSGSISFGEQCGANRPGMPLVFVKEVCVAGCPFLKKNYLEKNGEYQEEMLAKALREERNIQPITAYTQPGAAAAGAGNDDEEEYMGGVTPNYGGGGVTPPNGGVTPPYYSPRSPVEGGFQIAEDNEETKESQGSLSGQQVEDWADVEEEDLSLELGQDITYRGTTGKVTEFTDSGIVFTSTDGKVFQIGEDEMGDIEV